MAGRYLVLVLCAAMLGAAAANADPLSTPSMAGPLTPNPDPLTLGAGPLGDIFVTGAVSGLALTQNDPEPGDRNTRVDLSNAQIFIQKTDGPIQFYVQAGGYSLPSLATAYTGFGKTTDHTYGWLPVAYVKIAPTDNFSIEAGKLLTLVGAESTFTFQNPNIERGLLWNQTEGVSRGVQANYSAGALAVSVSLNDGFYSGRFNWLSGTASWTIDGSNSLLFIGSGNLGHTDYASFVNPLVQNNSDIFDLIYAYSAAPWTVSPYVQYTRVAADARLGFGQTGQSKGFGLFASYAFTPRFSLAGRLEYETTDGGAAAPDILFGPGSKAWSVTLTPTYQYRIFFARAEFSYVGAGDVTPGEALGPGFTDKSQVRGLLETGVVF
jgi:Putative beta-barrel porin-2, OmpL-like. bbp2